MAPNTLPTAPTQSNNASSTSIFLIDLTSSSSTSPTVPPPIPPRPPSRSLLPVPSSSSSYVSTMSSTTSTHPISPSNLPITTTTNIKTNPIHSSTSSSLSPSPSLSLTSSLSSFSISPFKSKLLETKQKWKSTIQETSKKMEFMSEVKLPLNMKKKNPISAYPIFGLPLIEAVQTTQLYPTLPIPAIVLRCIEYLESTGLKEVGLYRIPGASLAVQELKKAFELKGDVDLISMALQSPLDPHVVATLFKQYLRELSPLFPDQLPSFELLFSSTFHSPSLLNHSNPIPTPTPAPLLSAPTTLFPSSSSSSSSSSSTLKSTTFLPHSLLLLHVLIQHLIRVSYFHLTNKMNAYNLALIFSPTLQLPIPFLVQAMETSVNLKKKKE